MQKKVTIEILVDEQYLSQVYSKVSTAVGFIEDEDIEVTDVKVEDLPKIVLGPVPRLGALSGTAAYRG